MLENKEMRAVYCETMIELAGKNKKIVMLEADLMSSTGTKEFKKVYPKRLINVGIAEQNMIGVAAGLAACGKLPFVHSFTPFATRRCYDQIEISVAYAKQNVKIVGTDPGIMATNNGGTHMSLEDVGIMRAMPTMSVFEPVDSVMLRKLLPEVVKYDKPMYIRLFRKKTESVFDENTKFSLTKAIDLKKGKDVTIIASGIMVARAIEASYILEGRGYSVGVLSVHMIKPIDEEAIVKAAKRSGAIVTAENHNVIGGLGSAVAEVISENAPVPMKRVGVKDRFGEVGNEKYLSEIMGLTVDDIVNAAEEVIAKKK